MSAQSSRRRRSARPDTRDPKWVAVGQRIAALRKARNLRGYQVAQLTDVDPATISQIENGKRATGPERETLERLAGLFQVPIEAILGTENADLAHPHPRPDPGGDPTRPVELAAIRAAVSDAIFATVADILEAIVESRRTATDARGETERLAPDAPARTVRGGGTH